MKFKTIKSFNEYVHHPLPKHNAIDIGKYTDGFLKSSPPVYPSFYRISIKYGLENDKEKGYMYFSSPNQPIEWHTEEPWKGSYIAITEKLILSNQQLAYSFLNYGLHEPLFLKPEEELTITDLFNKALEEYNKENFSVNLLLAYCNLIFAHVAEFYKRQFGDRKESYTQLVDDFFTLLNNYYTRQTDNIVQPNVQYFAHKLSVTPNYLSDVIKFYTGNSALNHIHQYIINQAKGLIQQKQNSISEIAYLLGFEYPNYFSRLFKKQTGLTPSAYRNQ